MTSKEAREVAAQAVLEAAAEVVERARLFNTAQERATRIGDRAYAYDDRDQAQDAFLAALENYDRLAESQRR